MDKLLLTIEEAADHLSIGRTKAYELVAQGQLRSVTIGRSRRITVDAMHEFIASLQTAEAHEHTRSLRSRKHGCADRGQTVSHAGASTPPEAGDSHDRGLVA